MQLVIGVFTISGFGGLQQEPEEAALGSSSVIVFLAVPQKDPAHPLVGGLATGLTFEQQGSA